MKNDFKINNEWQEDIFVGFEHILTLRGKTTVLEFPGGKTEDAAEYINNYWKGSSPNFDSNINPLSSNPTKWLNTLKQFVGKLTTYCLSVFEHFVKLRQKGLREIKWIRLNSLNINTCTSFQQLHLHCRSDLVPKHFWLATLSLLYVAITN